MISPNNMLVASPGKLLSEQIAEHFREEIISGVAADGTKLPTCKEASEIFGVAAQTVNRPYDALVAENLVRRGRFVGTIVCREGTSGAPPPPRPLLAPPRGSLQIRITTNILKIMKKYNLNSRIRHCLTGALGVIITLGSVKATTVISYDANDKYVSSPQHFDKDFDLPEPEDTETNVRTWKYSDTIPISPTSGYSGPDIYAAIQIDSHSGNYANFADSSGIGTGATFARSQFGLLGNTGDTITTMVFFKPNTKRGETVKFDTDSSIRFLGNAVGTTTASGEENTRFVVKNDGKWYISTSMTWINEGDYRLASLDEGSLLASQWVLFDPVDKAPLPAIPASEYAVSGADFTNIQAVGIYASFDRIESGAFIRFEEFKVNASIMSGSSK